jgi:hypothetical protein
MICEDSIEHQILHLLGREQALADGLLDGQGDLGTLKMPSSGRAAMIERIEAMMRAPAAAADAGKFALAEATSTGCACLPLFLEWRWRGVESALV